MKKITLKLEQLFGLTSLKRTIKLQSSIDAIREEISLQDKIIHNLRQEAQENSKKQWDAIYKLQNPNWEKTTEERLELMSDSEQRTAWKLKESQFVIAREEEEYYVIVGKYRINNEPLKTLEEAIKEADKKDWERTMVLTQLQIESYNEQMSRPQRRTIKKNINKN